MPAPETCPQSSILVVDDHPAMREVVRDVLEMAGGAVLEAPSCDRALAMLSETTPIQAVVADIFMAGDRPDGIDMIARIRACRPEIRIIAVSGGAGGSDGSEALRAASDAGADACLAKPFSAKDLLRAVAIQ